MRRFAFPIHFVTVAGVILLLGLAVAPPASAFPFLLQTVEPTPRPTPKPEPYLVLEPSQGVAGDPNQVTASGGLWESGVLVILFWDGTGGGALAQTVVGPDGNFQVGFTTPTGGDAAAPGIHMVIAVQGLSRADAAFELLQPTPVDTPTATPTSSTTPTPSPTNTRTPVTPSVTPTRTQTPIPSPTLRPITPMVTITPIPPTPRPTRRPPTRTPIPTYTRAPDVTPSPTDTASATPTSTQTATPTHTWTPLATQTPGPSPTFSDTPTPSDTPSATPTPSDTPGPGTASATPQPTPTPVEEMADTGLGWLPIAAAAVVLAGLLIAFRLLRTRGAEGQG